MEPPFAGAFVHLQKADYQFQNCFSIKVSGICAKSQSQVLGKMILDN
jgi:hypothetical protein